MRLVSFLLLCLMGAPNNAYAEPHPSGGASAEGASIDPAATHRALLLGHQALLAFENGDYAAALSLFEEAERLAHSPVFLLYQARAAEKRGSWLQARALLARCAEERLSERAPLTWRSAVRSASTELALIEQRLPRLRLVADGSVALPLVSRIDGGVIRWRGSEPLEIALDPGAHRLVVTDSAGQAQTYSLEMKPARVLQLFISVQRSRRHLPDADPRAVATEKGPGVWASAERRAALAAFVLGGTGLAVGIGTLSAALVLAGDIKATCREFEGNQCPQSEVARVGRAVQMANISSVGFVVAGVGGAAGLGLWALSAKKAERGLSIQLRPDRFALTLDF